MLLCHTARLWLELTWDPHACYVGAPWHWHQMEDRDGVPLGRTLSVLLCVVPCCLLQLVVWYPQRIPAEETVP